MRVNREVLTFDVADSTVIATHHAATTRARDVAFVFLNAGYVPRDGHGGLSAQVCDALAEQGFHSFRLDMPGIGDAPGWLPDRAEELFDHVHGGAHAELLLEVGRRLARKFHLRGVVAGGLCGAAVTAIWAADRDPGVITGLVLLEPELFDAEDDASQKADPTIVSRMTHKLFAYEGWMRLLTMESRWGRFVPLPRKLLLNFITTRDRLPGVTNFPLAAAWRRVTERNTPTLVLTAAGKLREVFFDCVNRVILSDQRMDHVRHLRLAGTNHIFTTGGAIDRVREEIVGWAREKLAARPIEEPVVREEPNVRLLFPLPVERVSHTESIAQAKEEEADVG